MSERDPKESRSDLKRRRRRGPTRPNVHINIFQNVPAAGTAATEEPAAPAVEERDRDLEETLVSSEWLERRSKRLDGYEQDLRHRALELETREAELEQREAEFEAESFIRWEALEERERRLDDLEQRLDHKETELSSYAARLQGGFLRAG
jgi:chromosome segregation ATPase